MKTGILILFLVLSLLPAAESQPVKNDLRARFSIMVVPYTSTNEDILVRIEKDTGYKNAIAGINSALINMGYTKMIDFKTYKENIDNKHLLTEGKTWSEKINTYIENAPVDMIIETEITWINPPGNPLNRRAKLRLKAIDKYTSAVYADNASIQSAQREFPDLGTAVESALTRDGKVQFKNFLDQMDSSCSNLLRSGRQVNIQFGVEKEATNRFSDIIDNERLGDKIEGFIRQKAFHGQYNSIGESGSYMQFAVFVPLIDENGISQTPGWFLRKEMDSYFRRWGFTVSYSVVGNWINFTLLKRSS